MNNNYPFFKYISGDSKVHKMNSKYKILFILFMFILLAITRDIISLLILSVYVLFFISKTNINIKYYIYNTIRVYFVFLLTFIFVFLLKLDILYALFVSYKVMLAVLLMLALTFTTSLSEIAWGIECLFSKLKKIKIPVSKIALKIAMYIKFVSTVFEQMINIRKSMAYRGVAYTSKITALKNMIIPVLTLSYKSSKRIISSMKLRFYGYSKNRTNYNENKTTKFDKCLIIIECVMLYFIIWLGWYK